MVTWSNVISASIKNDFVESNNKKIRSKHNTEGIKISAVCLKSSNPCGRHLPMRWDVVLVRRLSLPAWQSHMQWGIGDRGVPKGRAGAGYGCLMGKVLEATSSHPHR